MYMFLSQKKHTRYGIAFDCGTATVKAALFSFNSSHPEKPPTILQKIHIPIQTADVITTGVLERKIFSALRHVLENVAKSHQCSLIHIGLSSPLYISQAIRLTYKREKPHVPIDTQEIKTLMNRGEQEFRKIALPLRKEHGFVVFSRSLLQSSVNGYHVQEPVGVQGKTIEIYARYEATTTSIAKKFHDSIENHFPGCPIQFTSISLVNFYMLHMLYPTHADMIYIDIGGEVTDISIIDNSMLERVITVAVGSNGLARNIQEVCRISYNDALFLLKRFGEGTLEEKYKKVLGEAAKSFMKEWKSGISEKLGPYIKEHGMSPSILVGGGGALVPLYAEAISKEFLEELAVAGNPSIEVVSMRSFEPYVILGGPTTDISDFNLLCLMTAPKPKSL